MDLYLTQKVFCAQIGTSDMRAYLVKPGGGFEEQLREAHGRFVAAVPETSLRRR